MLPNAGDAYKDVLDCFHPRKLSVETFEGNARRRVWGGGVGHTI